MNEFEVRYDAARNVIVIRAKAAPHEVKAEVSAELALRKQIPDTKAQRFGVARFLDLRAWQVDVVGAAITPLTAEQLMNDLSLRCG